MSKREKRADLIIRSCAPPAEVCLIKNTLDRTCAHCSKEITTREPYIEALLCRSTWVRKADCLMALQIGSNPIHIHRICMFHMVEGENVTSTELGSQPEPVRCDSCKESIHGEIMWRLEGGLWRYPFGYLCTLCGDSYVYGEV